MGQGFISGHKSLKIPKMLLPGAIESNKLKRPSALLSHSRVVEIGNQSDDTVFLPFQGRYSGPSLGSRSGIDAISFDSDTSDSDDEE